MAAFFFPLTCSTVILLCYNRTLHTLNNTFHPLSTFHCLVPELFPACGNIKYFVAVIVPLYSTLKFGHSTAAHTRAHTHQSINDDNKTVQHESITSQEACVIIKCEGSKDCFQFKKVNPVALLSRFSS